MSQEPLKAKANYNTFSKVSTTQNDANHPETKASLLSKMFLAWCSPLLRTGYERQLQPDDTWPLTTTTQCGHCTQNLLKKWNGTDSLFRAMLVTYGCRYMAVGLMLFASYACDLYGPAVLQNVVTLIQAHGPVEQVWYWLFGLLFSRIVKAILLAHFYYQTQIIMLQFTSALKGYVYQKTLRLNAKSRAEKNTADIVNLYTTDVSNIISAAFYLHYLWVLPILIGAILYMLFDVVSYATFAGLGTIVIILCINNLIAYFQRTYFNNIMTAKDNRMKVVNEIFGAIHIVKLNAWDERFAKKLEGVRTKELECIWKYLRLVAINIFLLWGAPVFVSTVTFAVYTVWMNEALTASKVFTAIALFRLLQEPLRSLPTYITGLIQAGVSVTRVKEFASLEERDPNNVIHEANNADDKALIIENGEFAWDTDVATPSIFQQINLSVTRGEFVVVHGKVGTGKSSFCSVLLGDMVKRNGTVSIDGSIAYCPQQAWIQNMTVRDNILFGQPYDEKKYKKVIEACGLTKDLKGMKGGDLTEIGEKGLNVSGGQKARISLARACYSDADIFLFDSPLAAVDAIVQNEIFTKCLLGLLRNKTRVLVTHNPEIIASKYVDRTIELGNKQFTDIFNPKRQTPDFLSVSPLLGRHSRDKLNLPLAKSQDGATEKSRGNISAALDSSNDGFAPLTKRASSFVAAVGDANSGKLVDEEERQEGRVSKEVYFAYFRAIGGIWICFFLIIVQVVWQMLQIGSDFWLTRWTNQNGQEQQESVLFNIKVYAALALGSAFMVFVRTMTISLCGLKGASRMFDSMSNALIHAPMSFFDANPIGRILNRYSDDTSNIDFRLPFAYGSLLAIFFSIGATLLTAAIVTRFMGLLMIPLIYIYLKIGTYYLKTARELNRLQKVTQSPVLSHISETVEGASVIRAFGSDQVIRFIRHNENVIDENNTNQFANFAVQEWFALRMQLMGGVILFIITCSLTLLRDFLSPGVIGLAFNYGLSVDQGLESLIQVWSWLETSMISPERVQEYIDIPSEAPQVIEATKPEASWPSKGNIKFDHVSFRYKVGGDLVLKDLSFTIAPEEKIGIVGRTGAGKSSLTMALFRINELAGGTIWIDSIDISQLGLRVLRERLSIITQTPVLFKGTLRGYLDPFDEYSDDALWNSLRKVNLAEDIGKMELKLLAPLEENGENFSVGERQLLCMARALLSNAKIVIMDEATAAIDSKTDASIQQVIRREFNNSTLITIAHRLDTVLDADKIMVLSQGNIVEFDSPKALISKGKGHLYDLAKEGGYLERLNF